jgi:hypothetical protein
MSTPFCPWYPVILIAIHNNCEWLFYLILVL